MTCKRNPVEFLNSTPMHRGTGCSGTQSAGRFEGHSTLPSPEILHGRWKGMYVWVHPQDTLRAPSNSSPG